MPKADCKKNPHHFKTISKNAKYKQYEFSSNQYIQFKKHTPKVH